MLHEEYQMETLKETLGLIGLLKCTSKFTMVLPDFCVLPEHPKSVPNFRNDCLSMHSIRCKTGYFAYKHNFYNLHFNNN